MKVRCATCGVVFSSPVLDFRRKDGDTFYCPNGHGSTFANLLQREREAAEAEAQRVAGEVAKLEELYKLEPTFSQRALQLFRGKAGA